MIKPKRIKLTDIWEMYITVPSVEPFMKSDYIYSSDLDLQRFVPRVRCVRINKQDFGVDSDVWYYGLYYLVGHKPRKNQIRKMLEALRKEYP